MRTKVKPEAGDDYLVEVGHRQTLLHLNPEKAETVTNPDDDDRLTALLRRVLPAGELHLFDVEWFCYDDHGWDVFVVRYCCDK